MLKLIDGTELTSEMKEAFKRRVTHAYIKLDDGTILSSSDHLKSVKLEDLRYNEETNNIIGEATSKRVTLGLPSILPKMSVSWFAEGGFPTKGDLFVANEAGAEWVGSMNGRTAVANQDQISTGVRQAAYEGMKQALSESDFGGVNVYNYLDSKDIASKMTKVKKSNEYMYG